MYISELELQGFKSFAYKTSVSFDKGITAIVGPNGCGKSNIVDSMRWVLGEQRPTLLRSSSMANVIFNGTAQKNALGMSEVSLTFINNKGLLPTEYNEVTITRRLYKSGESEYLINGTKCRLKDINELFMDTGMSSDAYSVIELKMVEEILKDKNNDRRRLFEEAAGITQYKEKRKKTFRKLDETTSDLQRVDDILSEVRKKANSLEKQAEKASKAKKYSKELHHLDKALNRYKLKNIERELEPLKERIHNAEKEKKEIHSKIEDLEKDEEQARQALNKKERNQSEAQRRVSQLHSSIRDAETKLQITKGKISNKENVVEQYQEDIKESRQDLKDLREAYETNKKKLHSFDDNLEKAAENLGESKQRYAEIQEEYSGQQKKLKQINQDISNINKSLSNIQTSRIKLESRLENTEGDIERTTEEIKDLKEQIKGFKDEAKERKRKLKQAKKEQAEQEETLKDSRQKREQLSEQQDELKDQIRSNTSSLESVQSEIKLLQDIAQSNEVFPSSVQYLLEQKNEAFSQLEVVSNILSTDEQHAVALEAVLGDALNFLVVDTLEDARQAAQMLKKHENGQATFIPLDQLSENYHVADGSLLHEVDCKAKFESLKQLLLGQVLLFDDVEKAYQSLDGQAQTGVTLKGEVITAQHFLQSGSKGEHAGIRVGLKDKISKLEDKAEDIRSDINQLKRKLNERREAFNSLDVEAIEQALSQKQQKVRDLENEINSLSSKTQIYEKNVGELNDRIDSLSGSEGQNREKLNELEPKHDELKQKLEDLRAQQTQKEEKLAELDEERAIAQSRYNDAQLEHQDLQNKVQNYRRDIRRAENGISNLEERLKLRSEKTEQAQKEIKEHHASINTLQEQMKDLRENKNEADSALEEAKKSSATQRGHINKLEKRLKEVRRQKEVNMELSHHLAMSKEKFEMQMKNISDYVWETYDILMDQIEKELPENTSADEAKKRISSLKQKLNKIGEVNPLAIEEYEEEKERLDFYKEQTEDLTTAAEELNQTIAQINETANKRFNDTFTKIRANFKKVFHSLFNEDDYCDLVIDEEAEDPLEARIQIKANPKGKRPSTINQLSGGEKTLTAIALLFAIYLVKPSPFCVLDEVDAPLDDANIERFSAMIKQFSQETQFIIITHNKKTMNKAEMMYGVTMPETGISRMVGVKMDEVRN